MTLNLLGALLQKTHAFQMGEGFAPVRQLRQAVVQQINLPVQKGLRQAHYFGRTKTAFQLYMTATVANMTRILAATYPHHPERSVVFGTWTIPGHFIQSPDF